MALPVICIFTFGAAGFLTLFQDENSVKIKGTILGLPEGKHGLLLHEKGMKDVMSCADLGDHFDYSSHGHNHGSHSGDLGNVDANAAGVAIVATQSPRATLGKGESSVINRAIAIHRTRDVLQPGHDEDSGPAIACCTIREGVLPPIPPIPPFPPTPSV